MENKNLVVKIDLTSDYFKKVYAKGIEPDSVKAGAPVTEEFARFVMTSIREQAKEAGLTIDLLKPVRIKILVGIE